VRPERFDDMQEHECSAIKEALGQPIRSKEALEQYNVLHEEVHQDQLLIHGQIFDTEFKKQMLKEAGKATSRKRKVVPEVEVVAVHELDNDSDNDEDDNSGG
jgi:hypothetical protein